MTVYQVRVFCAITSIILCFGLFQLVRILWANVEKCKVKVLKIQMRLNNDEISVNQNFRYEQVIFSLLWKLALYD